jgi:hypothetical protein
MTIKIEPPRACDDRDEHKKSRMEDGIPFGPNNPASSNSKAYEVCPIVGISVGNAD